MIKPELPSICLIISSKDVPEKLNIALKSGIKWVQYREKELPRKEIVKQAFQLREITYKYKALLIINDYLDIAIATESDGVHLGQKDLPLCAAKKIFSGIIGISTHNLQEAVEAQKGGADYVGFGPVFHTTTKKDALEPRGVNVLYWVGQKIKIPVVAIGGIRIENLKEIKKAKCKYIATASGILNGKIDENLKKFMQFFN